MKLPSLLNCQVLVVVFEVASRISIYQVFQIFFNRLGNYFKLALFSPLHYTHTYVLYLGCTNRVQASGKHTRHNSALIYFLRVFVQLAKDLWQVWNPGLFISKNTFNETVCVCVSSLSPLQGILLYCDYHASTFDMGKLPCHRFEAMDHFAKCFLILRLEGSQVEAEGGLQRAEGDNRGWRAVRVDLVSPPMDRFAFAVLGWTGSRVWRITETWWLWGGWSRRPWIPSERN